MRRVKIIHPIPSFLLPSLKPVGPFAKGDVVYLPEKVAELIVEKDRARYVLVNEPFRQWEVGP